MALDCVNGKILYNSLILYDKAVNKGIVTMKDTLREHLRVEITDPTCLDRVVQATVD